MPESHNLHFGEERKDKHFTIDSTLSNTEVWKPTVSSSLDISDKGVIISRLLGVPGYILCSSTEEYLQLQVVLEANGSSEILVLCMHWRKAESASL